MQCAFCSELFGVQYSGFFKCSDMLLCAVCVLLCYSVYNTKLYVLLVQCTVQCSVCNVHKVFSTFIFNIHFVQWSTVQCNVQYSVQSPVKEVGVRGEQPGLTLAYYQVTHHGGGAGLYCNVL